MDGVPGFLFLRPYRQVIGWKNPMNGEREEHTKLLSIWMYWWNTGNAWWHGSPSVPLPMKWTPALHNLCYTRNRDRQRAWYAYKSNIYRRIEDNGKWCVTWAWVSNQTRTHRNDRRLLMVASIVAPIVLQTNLASDESPFMSHAPASGNSFLLRQTPFRRIYSNHEIAFFPMVKKSRKMTLLE